MLGLLPSVQAITMVHEFYLPMPEDQIRSTFTALETGVGTNLDSVFSIVITGPGTIVHYDQWEDGYEIDISSPIQPSTQIWGDGNDANGKPPGFAHDPVSFPAGTVLSLRNVVPYPRASSTNLFFDGRDRVAGSKALVISRTAWATTPGTVLAGASEVTATMDYGTNYVCPVGQDVLASGMFQYVAAMVMAEQNGTLVTIDKDGSGSGAPFTVPLNRGESYLVNGGIMKGARITATKPVQADLVTGKIGARYETDWFTLYPVEQWDSSYVTPVGTAANGNQCYVFVYNPNTNTITVNYATRVGSGSFSVATNATYQYLMPQNSGALLSTTNGARFFALSTVGAAPSANNVFDWGFTLLPSSYMTTEAVVGWGPGSGDLTQNGSPVWVTPAAATRVYVDYNGDRLGPKTDPAGNKYDVDYDLAALQSQTVYDPDKDQTAMHLYTLNGIPISTAWGEDPSVAGPGNPYLDVGTTVLPFPVPILKKTSRLYTDNAPSGMSTNDILEYTITVDNKGLLPLGNTVVIDQLPASIAYQTNTMAFNGNSIADNAPTNTPFPLDESGYTIPIILRGGTSMFTFRVRIVGSGAVINSGFTGSLSVSNEVDVPPPVGAHSNTIAFVGAATNDVIVYTAGDGIYVKLTDLGVNQATTTVETVSVIVRDTTSGDLETVVLRETGPNTGIFVSTNALPTSLVGGLNPQDGTLKVAAGDALSITFTDPMFGDSTSDTATVIAPTLTKVLYLSDPTQALDRIDPMATGDNTSTQTVSLGYDYATVGVSAVSTGSNKSVTSITVAHTTPTTGTNRLMVVAVTINRATTSTYETVTNVVYGTRKMTNVGSLTNGEAVVSMWTLVNPPTGTSNVVVRSSATLTDGAVVGVITFTNVDQTVPYRPFVSAFGSGSNVSLVVTSATSELVFDAVMLRSIGFGTSGSPGAGQTAWWKQYYDNHVGAGASTEPGSGIVTMTWTAASTSDWVSCGISIKPATLSGGTNWTTFTQAPTFAMPFNMASGGVIRVTNFVTVLSGTMPASPAINVILGCGGTNFLTLTNAAYNSTASNIVWSGLLTNAFAALTNQAISMTVTSLQSGVLFRIDYDSSNKASQIRLPTTNVIAIASLGVYDAPYPGGASVAGAANGDILYVRATVTDPFGNYDINRLALSIDGTGSTADVSVTLSNAQMVASNAYSKTYEYKWYTAAVQGNYALGVTAYEGTEGITAAASIPFSLTYLDLGTPSTTEFTTGANGPHTLTYATNEIVCVRVTDLDQNTNAAAADTITVRITNSLTGDWETRTLTETGPNTGVFTGSVAASSTTAGSANDQSLYAPAGSPLAVFYVDPDDSSDQSSDTAMVPSPGPLLTVRKTRVQPADGLAVVGETVEFNVEVINSGNTTMSTVTVTDTYSSATFTYVSATPAPSTVVAGTLTWTNVGPLLPGGSTLLDVFMTAGPSSGLGTNRAVGNAGGVAATGTATAVVSRPGVSVVKSLVSPIPGPAVIGGTVQYRIVVSNGGDTALASVPLQDLFSSITYAYVSASTTPDVVGFGSLYWSDITGAGSLAAGASWTNLITMRALGGGNPAPNTVLIDSAVDVNGDTPASVNSVTGVTISAVTISGTVYNDLNTNGSYNAGDLPLADVTVRLYTDPNGDGNPADGTLVDMGSTLANGTYEFLNLGTGRYVVVETDLPGYASSGDTAAPNDNRIPAIATVPIAYTNNNFFDYLLAPTNYASIRGTVFLDANGNGTADDGVGAILSGVSIDLIQDVNSNGVVDVGEPVIQSIATGTNGTYQFFGVIPGAYVVRESDLPGYLSTADTGGTNDNRIAVTVGTGQTSSGNDFFDAQPVAIAGSVLLDVNGNGTAEGGDTNGVPNAIVTLYDASSNVAGVVTTGVSGAYSFTNLPPGSYTVVETDPAGYRSTADTVGPNDNRIPLTMTSGQSSTGNNFMDAGSGAIGDRIWLDENGDGVQDAGEAGLANVSVVLYATNGVALVTTVTDSRGQYLFTGLPAGTYTVRVDTNSMPAGLAANPTFDPDGTTNHQTTVILSASATVLIADFGYNWVPPPDTRNGSGTGAIGDRVWVDADGDGVQDPGEPGLSNMTVRLYADAAGNGNYTSLVATATTDAAGNYIFDGLAAGAYVVVVNGGSTPAGYTATGDPDSTLDNRTTTPIILAPGDVYVNADFGYRPAAGSTIGDTVFFDGNADGTNNGTDYGIAGVTVALLDGNGRVVATTITATNGVYQFTGLPAGTYTVWVNDTGSRLAGMTPTADPDGGSDCRSTVTVNGVTSNLLQDFGYRVAGQSPGGGLIGDTIFLDRDGNSVAGAGEGLAGIGVGLYTTGGVLLASAMTDANGHYAFGGLSTNNASYVVRVDTNTLPAGVTNSFDPDGGIINQATVVLSGATPINLAQDFGYRAVTPNTIAGTLWVDASGDGTLGAGETGRVGGITVTLYGTNGNGVATTVTDGSGNYSFGGLPAGTYRVDVTDDGNRLNGYWHSAGPTPGADNNSQRDPYTVTVSGGQADSTGDFGYFIEGGAVGNRTWFDDNGNGIQNTGEVGLSNVVVRLRAVYANGTTTQVYTVSGTNGYYSFGGLLLDESFITNGPVYAVSIPAIPVGYYVVPKHVGTDPWLDSGYIYGEPVAAVRGVTDVGLRSDPRTEATQGSYDFGFDNSPTLAVISGFRAATVGGRTWVGWETAAELGTVGYYLERWAGTNWASVNEDILFVDDAEPLPHVYVVEDAGAVSGGTYTWQIVELDDHNRLIAYGPYTVTVDGLAINYETWAAMHFVDLLALEAARSADADGDGLTNFEEYLAGTNPRDRNSVLKVTGVESRPAAGEMVLRWQSEADRAYSVELATNLARGFLPFERGILATPPSNVHTIRVDATSGSLYFRVVVE